MLIVQAGSNEQAHLEHTPGIVYFQTGGAVGGAATNRLLLETAGYLLLENSDFLEKES